MSKRNKIIGIVMAGVLTSGLVMAQGRRAGQGQMRKGALLAAYLDLDEGQRQKAKEIFEASREAAAPVREQLKQMRQAMHAAVTSGTEQQIERIAQAQGALMAKAIVIHSKAMQEFYALLTPEQKQKAEKMRGLLRGFRAGPDPVQ